MLPEFSASKVWSHLLSLDTPVMSRVNLFMAVPTIYAKLIEEYEDKLVKNTRMIEYVKAICMQNIRLVYMCLCSYGCRLYRYKCFLS